ncbi:hypothetical protein HDU96_001236 [Phlyctochytrium bullatum]|nr:hypothetical protein HDU96_001236 [Phlyctochytrium bullatum]
MTNNQTREMFERVGGLMSSSLLISTLYIADKLNLFKLLSTAGDHGYTLQELASGTLPGQTSPLSERYLRECLHALVTGGFLELKPGARYVLPQAYIPVLVDVTSPLYSGGWIAMAPIMSNVADKVAACFVKDAPDAPDKGVPFSEFGDAFVCAMSRAHGPGFVRVLTEKQLPKVPGFLEKLARPGAVVADVGCGGGNVVLHLAKKYPDVKFFGFDVDAASIQAANANLAKEPSVKNVTFEVRRAEELPFAKEGPFDVIMTVDVVHDIPFPKVALKEIRKALAGDGIFIMLEPKASSDVTKNFSPRGSFLYSISLHHCMTQSLANGGEGVGAAWGKEEAEKACMECGFTSFEEIDVGNAETAFYRLTAQNSANL